MPRYIPQHTCSAGCGRLANAGSGRCPACTKKDQRQHDTRRGTPSARGYDADHQRLRLQAFERDGWRCVDCGWEPDIIRGFRQNDLGEPPTDEILEELRQRKVLKLRHLHGEHDVPVVDRPDLRLDLDNYRTRCNLCHAVKTMRESLART